MTALSLNATCIHYKDIRFTTCPVRWLRCQWRAFCRGFDRWPARRWKM